LAYKFKISPKQPLFLQKRREKTQRISTGAPKTLSPEKITPSALSQTFSWSKFSKPKGGYFNDCKDEGEHETLALAEPV
jgi:hypothetical protein